MLIESDQSFDRGGTNQLGSKRQARPGLEWGRWLSNHRHFDRSVGATATASQRQCEK